MKLRLPRRATFLLILLLPVALQAQSAGALYRGPTSFETLNLTNYKEVFELLLKSDESYKKPSRLIRLYHERSLKICAEEAITDLSAIENQSSYIFVFYFGSKCLGRLAVTENSMAVHEEWLKYIIDYETIASHDKFLESEKLMIKAALLNARETLFRKSDELGLDDMKTEALARRIRETKSESIAMKLFEFYMKKNDQDSARDVFTEFDPEMQNIQVLKKLNQHFPDQIVTMKMNNLLDADKNYKQIKQLYRRKKYDEVLATYKASYFKDSKHFASASKVIAWTYVNAKQELKNIIINEFAETEIDFEVFAWILSNRGLYDDVLHAYNNTTTKTDMHHRMALKAILNSGEYNKANDIINKLGIIKTSNKILQNTKAKPEEILALRQTMDPEVMYWAVLNLIRAKNYKSAITVLDVLASVDTDYKLQALYFKYRILKHELKSKDYKKEAEVLVKEYPLTFYGILAAHEEGLTNLLPFLNDKSVSDLQLNMQEESDLRALKQLIFIVDEKMISSFGNFFDKTLSQLSLPAQIIMAKHFQDLGYSLQAVKVMNNVWTLNHSYIRKEFIAIAYPTLLLENIKTHASKDLDPYVVLSVIRQESAFQERAVSPARARGLMQLLTATAREMARRLRMKVSLPSALFNPDVNIKLGSSYLARLSDSYGGHLPLAFAAYNAGPGRMRGWSSSRDIITKAQENKYSDDWKEQDLWVEELPWSETRFYVKALLRNYALYTLFENYKPLEKCYRLWNCKLEMQNSENTDKVIGDKIQF